MEAKPCPCCGNTNLFLGTIAQGKQGVKCLYFEDGKQGCGLQISRDIELIRNRLNDTIEIDFAEAKRKALEQAIVAWDLRLG